MLRVMPMFVVLTDFGVTHRSYSQSRGYQRGVNAREYDRWRRYEYDNP